MWSSDGHEYLTLLFGLTQELYNVLTLLEPYMRPYSVMIFVTGYIQGLLCST